MPKEAIYCSEHFKESFAEIFLKFQDTFIVHEGVPAPPF